MARIWCTKRSGFHEASSSFQGPRELGISRPPYASFNLGSKVGDEIKDVIANRRALTKACQLEEIRFMDQIHSALMVESKVEDNLGREGRDESCDGFFLRREPWNDEIGLAVQVADCVPLILHGDNVIAAVHVGREGLVKGMTESAIEGLARHIDLARLTAVIGPSICGDCYPLSQETFLPVAKRYPESIFSEPELKIDVAAGVISILENRDIPWKWLGSRRECVSCDSEYFSHRRDRVTGRQVMVVAW